MKKLKNLIENSKYPVALTGAGISAPSGIPTFDMQWKGKPVREFLSRDFFNNYPFEFYELYKQMVKWQDKKPNYAHKALAHYNFSIVTQNVDGLHQKAGSEKVIELHGSTKYVVCPKCGNKVDSFRILSLTEIEDRENMPDRQPEDPNDYSACQIQSLHTLEERIYCHQCNTLMEPDIVLYGDNPKNWWEAFDEVAKADLLLVIGTSLQTYPANQLPVMAERYGCKVVYINDDCMKAFSFFNNMRKETLSIEYVEREGVSIRISDKMQERIDTWLTNHNCPLPEHPGPIGGKITYSFTQTSLGNFFSINCSCGQNLIIEPSNPLDL